MGTTFISRTLPHFRSEDLFFRVDQDNLQVRIEQFRTRMEMYPALIFSQVILQPFFVWMFWNQASHAYLLLWLACFWGLHAVEVVNWILRRKNLSSIKGCRDWHRYFTFFAFTSGGLWGVASVLFFPEDIGYQALMICIMLGLVAGAVTMNPVHLPALYSYQFGVMLPLTARVMYEGDNVHWILSIMLVTFLAVVLVAALDLNKTFMLSITQRFENIELLQLLTVQKTELEEARSGLEQANNVLRNEGVKLENMVQERTVQLLTRTKEMELIKDTTIIALSSLAETRDNETGNHIRRTQNYIKALAEELKDHPRFKHFLTEDNIRLLYRIAPLHDVGKVGIPDHILHKPGKLTEEEFEIMKNHAALGGNAIAAAVEGQHSSSPFLKIAYQIAMSHHEKWDGSGYPERLRGDDIPIPARLMAVADVYDALSCQRVYKAAMPPDEVRAIILEGRGKHFDPDIVDAYQAIQQQFIEIADKYRD